MKRIRAYFHSKTPEQILSLCLLIVTSFAMLLCVIARLCGCLWFAADLTSVKEPSKFWQEVIKGALLVFELVFVYKILCRASWLVCFGIAVVETLVGILLGETVSNAIVINLFNMACILFIPVFFVRSWFSLLENAILYCLSMLYGVVFLVGRIGGINDLVAYSFVESILGTIDYKLFIVSLYFVVKYFGGIRLWKTQKRLIFQRDLRK